MSTNTRSRLNLFYSMRVLAMVAAGLFLVVSCNNNKTEDTKDVAESRNDERLENRKAEKDADFLVAAATISMEEIGLGELAKTKGVSQDVKDLGAKMVTDHQKSLDELKALAERKSIALPASLNEEAQKAIGKYAEKEGKDFDKDYCDKMVDSHEDAISKFEKEVEDGQDPDIKAWASETLPSLRTHLEHAKSSKEKCDKNKK